MILLYRTTAIGGKHLLHYAVWDAAYDTFVHSTNVPLSELEIDEAENAALCVDLDHYINGPFKNSSGDKKYYIDETLGTLHEEDGWVQEEEA